MLRPHWWFTDVYMLQADLLHPKRIPRIPFGLIGTVVQSVPGAGVNPASNVAEGRWCVVRKECDLQSWWFMEGR